MYSKILKELRKSATLREAYTLLRQERCAEFIRKELIYVYNTYKDK